MNSYLIIFVIVTAIYLCQRQVTYGFLTRHLHSKQRRAPIMRTLAAKFVGKECYIYTLSNYSYCRGTILEVGETGLLVSDRNNTTSLINLDLIVRICEVPAKRSKAKKSDPV